MTSTNRSQDSFPDLNVDELKRYANRWIDKYRSVPISKIDLYHYSTEYPNEHEQMLQERGIRPEDRKPLPVKYAIVFEMADETTSALSMFEEGYSLLDWEAFQNLFDKTIYEVEELCKLSKMTAFKQMVYFFSWIPNEQIQALLAKSKQMKPDIVLLNVLAHERVQNDYDRLCKAVEAFDGTKGYLRYPALLDSGFFTDVQKGNGKDSDWRFFIRRPGKPLSGGIKINEPHQILYDIESSIKQADSDSFTSEQKQRFDDLNLTELVDSAAQWCRSYDFIEKVSLHRSEERVEKEGIQNVLVFQVNELYNRWESKSKTAFQNWLDHSTFYGILSQLRKVYLDKEKKIEDIKGDWFTPIIQNGEKLDGHVSPGTEILLAWRVEPKPLDAEILKPHFRTLWENEPQRGGLPEESKKQDKANPLNSDLIEKARKILPQIERFISDIEEAGNWDTFREGLADERADILSEHLQSGKYSLIKKQDIEDQSLLSNYTITHERHQLAERLLKTVLKSEGYGGKINARELRKACKKQK
ncbi:MAG: hypothetical protein C4530_17860 [Desulfobacteraceae bacterium]|nr:MAG: hypothetical protein C4530_17860 [Desulfobacteraceae bacterium]